MWKRIPFCIAPALFAVYMPMCTPNVHPTANPWDAHMAELWQKPVDMTEQDLFYGPWGLEHAPASDAVYTFVAKKDHGTNPGVVVTDPEGREWHVKQPPSNNQGAEGPVEVVLSRVLSALGYHQPPVYFLPSFTMQDDTGTHTVPGGRFRLKLSQLDKKGDWQWQQNPFVGTKPHQGLLVILLMFNSSDLKNVNNSLYEFKTSRDQLETWYVVRDLGTALGETGRLHPKRSNIDIFENEPFITGVKDGYVEFAYHGWHKEIIRNRITPDDVRWASDMMASISYDQWMDAFRAGGYEPAIAERFVKRLMWRVSQGQRVGLGDGRLTMFMRPAMRH